jgi:hypothetical protein
MDLGFLLQLRRHISVEIVTPFTYNNCVSRNKRISQKLGWWGILRRLRRRKIPQTTIFYMTSNQTEQEERKCPREKR